MALVVATVQAIVPILNKQPFDSMATVGLVIVSYGGTFLITRYIASQSQYEIRPDNTIAIKYKDGRSFETIVKRGDVDQIFTSRRPFFQKYGLVDLTLATKNADIPIFGISEASADEVKRVLDRP